MQKRNETNTHTKINNKKIQKQRKYIYFKIIKFEWWSWEFSNKKKTIPFWRHLQSTQNNDHLIIKDGNFLFPRNRYVDNIHLSN